MAEKLTTGEHKAKQYADFLDKEGWLHKSTSRLNDILVTSVLPDSNALNRAINAVYTYNGKPKYNKKSIKDIKMFAIFKR